MTRYAVIIFILLIIDSCRQTSGPLTKSEEKEIIDTIHKTLDNYFSDIRRSGLTAEFSYLDSSKDFFWVPPGYSSAFSYDSIVAIIKQNAALYRNVNNSFDTLRIIPLNRELATYTGRVHSIITDTVGKTSRFVLLEKGILIKRPGGWKLLSGQTSVLK